MRKLKLNADSINTIKQLRSQGYSLPEISRKVKIPKTTVYRYTRGIEVLEEYKENWLGKRGGSRKIKLFKEKKALEEAKALIKDLTYKEKLLVLSALYWAEGSKKDFGLSNTDPYLVKIFVHGLREVFGITNDRLKVSVRIYEDLDREKCLNYWAQIVGVPKEDFVNVNVLQGKKKGKLSYGMCRIRVAKGGDLLKKIVGINKIVVGYLSP